MKYSSEVYDKVMEAFDDFKEEVLDILEDCKDYSEDYAVKKEKVLPTPKFKVGDKVKVIDNSTCYDKDSIQKVSFIEIDKDGEIFIEIDEDGEIFIGIDDDTEGEWHEYPFELVVKEEEAPKAKFKIGDIVKVVSNGNFTKHYLKIGSKVTVKSGPDSDGDYFCVGIPRTHGGAVNQWVSEADLELFKKEKKESSLR